MRHIIAFTVIFTLFSCQREQPQEQPVVQVFESMLYPSELSEFVPKGTSPEDSVIFAQNFVRNWVTQKLLLHKAIENLSFEQHKIQKQVEEYRTSLLIHEYKRKLIEQRLKDDINEIEIEEYYQKNEQNFVLSTPIAKVVFCIIPKNAPNQKQLRKWFLSDKEEDQDKLEDYCLSNAKKYDRFNDRWIEAKFLLNLIPGAPQALSNEIFTRKNIEKEDENNFYYLKIKELKKEQTIAPLDYVRDEIVLILKNKKKLQFEHELEKLINEEGRQKKYVKFH